VALSKLATLIEKASDNLASAHFVALRTTMRVYDRIITAVEVAVAGGADPSVALQRELNGAARDGIVAFTSGGRSWSLATYSEMAARTAIANANLDGKLSTFRDANDASTSK
jgi:hypothetical protein